MSRWSWVRERLSTHRALLGTAPLLLALCVVAPVGATGAGVERVPARSLASAAPTEVKDSPLFVSADYPNPAAPGTTVRFVVTCSKPIVDGDDPQLDVTAVGADQVEGFTALSGDVTRDGSGYFVEWDIPVDQPVGQYTVVANCDGPDDTFGDIDYPAGISSGFLPFQVANAAPAVTVPSAIPSTL